MSALMPLLGEQRASATSAVEPSRCDLVHARAHLIVALSKASSVPIAVFLEIVLHVWSEIDRSKEHGATDNDQDDDRDGRLLIHLLISLAIRILRRSRYILNADHQRPICGGQGSVGAVLFL